MAEKNICKFNIPRDDSENISILNFVYETESTQTPHFTVQSLFRMHIVTSGNGQINTLDRSTPIEEGDLFVTFPSTNYCITGNENLEYEYISFVGLRAYKLLDRAGISKQDYIKKGMTDLLPIWKTLINESNAHNIDLIAESLLLYSIGLMTTERDDEGLSNSETFALWLKKRADDDFGDPTLSLSSASREKFYSPKYASTIFKKHMGIGFTNYLLNLRINNAQRLIDMGMTSIKEISTLSGFSDPFYFSRVFKQRFEKSPSEYIDAYKKRKNVTSDTDRADKTQKNDTDE